MPARLRQMLSMVAVFAALLFGFVLVRAVAPAQPARARQLDGAATTAKTAGQVFKNVQVLNNIPANQLIPSMEFIASSLGVHCGFCHVEGAFWKDDKRPKLTARRMIRMELAINKENFGGHTVVTCYTCHRGLTHPVGVPVIGAETVNHAQRSEMGSGGENPEVRSTVGQVLDKYVQALGGADALRKITTRIEKGAVSGRGGQKIPVDVISMAPDEKRTTMYSPRGTNVKVYNGHEGWMASAGRPVQQITGGELNALKLDADFHLALDLQQHAGDLRAGHPEMIDGREMDVLMDFKPGHPPVKFYFDAQSGLLARIEHFTPTPLGNNPSQIEFADYRETGGVKVPFRQTISQPGRSLTIQFDQVQQNVPVNDSEFAQPPASAAPAANAVSP